MKSFYSNVNRHPIHIIPHFFKINLDYLDIVTLDFLTCIHLPISGWDAIMKFSLSVKDVEGSHDKLHRFHEGYTQHFFTKTRDMAIQSYQYLHGKLIGKGRGTMCSYAKEVPDCDKQSLQHFVSIPPGKHQPVLDHIQREGIGLTLLLNLNI